MRRESAAFCCLGHTARQSEQFFKEVPGLKLKKEFSSFTS